MPYLSPQSRKRIFDLAVLVSAHILLLPLWLVLWTMIPLAIKVDDKGPIFYRQTRVGKNGSVFSLMKFRTMVPEADRLGPAWTSEADPRITRAGKLLRKTAMDELPTLLAIWKGHMSFVGPRALATDEHAWLQSRITGFAERLLVRPGLTGLAQVYNPDDEPNAKLQYDLKYIEQAGVWLDLKLMILSIRNTVLARWDTRTGKPTGSGK